MASVRREILEKLKTDLEALNPDPSGNSKLEFTVYRHWVNPYNHWDELPVICIERGNEDIDLTLFGVLPSRRFPVTLGLYHSYDDESITLDSEDMLQVIISSYLTTEATAAEFRGLTHPVVLTHIGPVMFDLGGEDREDSDIHDVSDYALHTIPLIFEWVED